MPEVIFYNDVFLNERECRRLCLNLEAAARSMNRKECLRLSIVDNNIVIETSNVNNIIELEPKKV